MDAKWTDSRLDGQAATDFEPDVGAFRKKRLLRSNWA
jgi:hypothetical protein